MPTLEQKIKRRRFFRKYRVVIVIGLFLLCGAIISAATVLFGSSLAQDQNYEDAYAAMQSGNYQAAQRRFAALGDYLDSPEQARLAGRLIELDEALAREDVDEAKELLQSSPIFPLREQTQTFIQGLDLYLNGDYSRALERFLEINGFKNSGSYIARCNEYIASQTPEPVSTPTPEPSETTADSAETPALQAVPAGLRAMFGGSGDDIVHNMLITRQGNILVCGATTSSDGDIQTPNRGDYDGLAMLVSPDGRVLWCQSYGGSGYDVFSYAMETSDGGFVFTGVTNSSDPDATTARGLEDVWLIKTDAHGTQQWGGTLGGSHTEFGKAVASNDGGLLIAGQTASLDGDMEGNHGKYDGFAIKLDSSGAITWSSMFGGSEDDGFHDCLALADGYLLLGSTASEDGDLEETTALGGTDNWAVKISLTGETIIFNERWGGSDADSAIRILPAAQGGYAIASYTESGDTGAPNRRGSQDIWVQFSDAQFNTSYQTLLGSSGDDDLLSMWSLMDGVGISARGDAADGDFSVLSSPGNAIVNVQANAVTTANGHFAGQFIEINAAASDAAGQTYYCGTSYAPVGDLTHRGEGDIYIECIGE